MGKKVLVIRGDTFRSDALSVKWRKGDVGCSNSYLALENQARVLESIQRHVIEPWQANGDDVYVAGAIYACPGNSQFIKALEKMGTDVSRIQEISRENSTQQSTTLAALETIALDDDLDYVAMVRADQTIVDDRLATFSPSTVDVVGVLSRQDGSKNDAIADQVHVGSVTAMDILKTTLINEKNKTRMNRFNALTNTMTTQRRRDMHNIHHFGSVVESIYPELNAYRGNTGYEIRPEMGIVDCLRRHADEYSECSRSVDVNLTHDLSFDVEEHNIDSTFHIPPGGDHGVSMLSPLKAFEE